MHLAVTVGTVLGNKKTIATRTATVIIQEITDVIAATDTGLGDVALLTQLGPGPV